MVSILISRVIGFFREWILARTVGANSMTDVYYASFTIPDFLNYLMAAGALSISFVPMLSRYLTDGQKELGGRVFRMLSTYTGGCLLILILLAEILAPQLTDLVAPGFNGEQRVLLIQLLRIILPAQLFFLWGGIAIAVQHTHGKFLLPALAPIIYNLGIIVCGLLFSGEYQVAGFSIGVTVGAFLGHGVLQWWGIRGLGYSALPYFSLDEEMKAALKKYVWLSLPIMVGFSLVVTDEWISKYFATLLEPRAVTWLSYARTEMRIPIAIIGQAAGIASFPFLARLYSAGKHEEYARTLILELEKLWFLAPLATLLLVNHALPITHFIYGGGRLTHEDLVNTSESLKMFGYGVFFWTAQVLLARGFYASQRTWLPSLLGTLLSALLIPVYAKLSEAMGFRGLALSGSIGISIYTAFLWYFLRTHIRKTCPGFSFAFLYKFMIAWTFFLGILGAISWGITRVGIYQNTQLTAFLEILAALAATLPLAYLIQRKVTRRLTDQPLF